jgi:U32 family peptidase
MRAGVLESQNLSQTDQVWILRFWQFKDSPDEAVLSSDARQRIPDFPKNPAVTGSSRAQSRSVSGPRSEPPPRWSQRPSPGRGNRTTVQLSHSSPQSCRPRQAQPGFSTLHPATPTGQFQNLARKTPWSSPSPHAMVQRPAMDSAIHAINPATPAPETTAPARLPELLAPAGDWECARAAVENGADAIYFGLDQFNARMRARNFTESDLPPLLDYLHRRGVKGYVTFNTLVFPEELKRAERFARAVIAAGTDGAIVQDVGICRLIRALSPDFPLHASTQMTITSAAGVAFARELGCAVVVLAREVPIREIAQIQTALRNAHACLAGADRAPGTPQVDLEVFVHGALCVAYSGQCLTSESLGGRSANRGVCAQACRLPYELLADGRPVDLGDRRYLLSPQDLAGIELLPDLVRAGVASLKIEGRLKTPEYVANITRAYRQTLDAVFAALTASSTDEIQARREAEHTARAASLQHRYSFEMAFSRGLDTGWMKGINNQTLVHARFGTKRGVFLGHVTAVRTHEIHARLVAPLRPGDGVVFDAGRPDLPEEGGRVYRLTPLQTHPTAQPSADYQLEFGNHDLDLTRIKPGDRLWKTSDPELNRRLRESFTSPNRPQFQRPVDLDVLGSNGQPLVIIARDELGHVVRAQSSLPLAPARNQPLTPPRLRHQLGRLGGSPFTLRHLESSLDPNLILPISELNRLRREFVSRLEQRRAQPPRWSLCPNPPRPAIPPEATGDQAHRTSVPHAPPQLTVLVRRLDQLETVLDTETDLIYCDFEDPRRYRDAVALFRSRARTRPDSPKTGGIFLAPPRVHKTGEDWILRQVESAQPDGILVRNYDHLRYFVGARRIGDYSLNVANALTAGYFQERHGLERVTASYDLNATQLAALLRSTSPARFEITLHQHMPMFHMEHCVFCAFLSAGTDYTNCGRPCDRHEVHLRDRVGTPHPVRADAGCRNTVFNALAQTGAEQAHAFIALGARWFRLEFLDEPPAVVGQTLARYRQLLHREISGRQLWRELKLTNHLGVTRGPAG